MARFETSRLRLRPLNWQDFPFTYRLSGDPYVRHYLGGPLPWHRRLARFRSYRTSNGAWVILARCTGWRMGLIFIDQGPDDATFELSFLLVPAHWGQGFGAEAARCLIDHAVNHWRARQLIVETQAANMPARRLAERLGFSEVERLDRFGTQQIVYQRRLPPS